MPKATLTLVKNEQGEQELRIDYESDAGALPFEHEDEHRDFKKKVLEGDNDSVDEDRVVPETATKEPQEQTPTNQQEGVKN